MGKIILGTLLQIHHVRNEKTSGIDTKEKETGAYFATQFSLSFLTKRLERTVIFGVFAIIQMVA